MKLCPDNPNLLFGQLLVPDMRYSPQVVAGRSPWLAAGMLLVFRLSSAQEALRNSMTNQVSAESRRAQFESAAYTFKSGDFRFLATTSLGVDWNDNVNLSPGNAESDFIIMPTAGFTATYPITDRNLLQANVTFGYSKYVEHDELSTWYIQSGSELSFDIGIKEWNINLHDRVSYVQDAGQQALVAGPGAASYGTFQNTVGILASWGLKDFNLSLGYDHLNLLSTTSTFDSENHDSEMFSARAGFQVHPKVNTGIELTTTFTTYDQQLLNNNVNYSAGVYADWQVSQALHIQPRGGYTIYNFQQTSQTVQTSDLNSWYLDLNATHDVTKAISYSIDVGHEIQLGVQSDLTEDWYVRPAVTWKFIKALAFNTSLSYQNGKQGIGNVAGNLTEKYEWLGANFSLSHALSSRFTLSLNYRLTIRSSDIPSNEYTQNMVGLLIAYTPK
jgi:hypothetical protein